MRTCLFCKVFFLIAFLVISNQIAYSQEKPTLYPKKVGTNYGFYNSSGTLIIAADYDDALGFSNGLAPVKKSGKWGYINESGTKVIDFLYDDAWFFTNNLAAVKKDGQWGYIDKTGATKIEFKFDDAADFSEGLAWVKKDKKIGYIDKDGKIMIDYQYGAATAFEDGLAGVQKNAKWGFIDKDGKIVIDYKYDEAKNFDNGLAPVKLINKWGFIDKTGKLIIDYQYSEVKQNYRDASFGWTYAEGAYNQAKLASAGSTDYTNCVEHLNKAIKIIQDKNTYLYRYDWEKLLKYYTLTGDTEKAAIAKKKIKELKSGSSSGGFNIGGSTSKSNSIDLSIGIAPIKPLFYKTYKQLPILAQLRIGQIGLGFRYNKYGDDGYRDKFRFGAWMGGTNQDTVSNVYTGSDVSLLFKYFDRSDIDDGNKIGYGHKGPYYGGEFRHYKYDFFAVQAEVFESSIYGTGQSLGIKTIDPFVKGNDLSFVMGYNYSQVPFFVDLNYSIGIGYRTIDMKYKPSSYEIMDDRFLKSKWTGLANFYMPFRIGIRVGVTIL